MVWQLRTRGIQFSNLHPRSRACLKPQRKEKSPFSFKVVGEAEVSTNQPRWVSRALFMVVHLAHMVAKMKGEDMKAILLDLRANENKDGRPWI